MNQSVSAATLVGILIGALLFLASAGMIGSKSHPERLDFESVSAAMLLALESESTGQKEHLIVSDYCVEVYEDSRLIPGTKYYAGDKCHCPRCGAGGIRYEHGMQETCELCGLHLLSHGNGVDIWDE